MRQIIANWWLGVKIWCCQYVEGSNEYSSSQKCQNTEFSCQFLGKVSAYSSIYEYGSLKFHNSGFVNDWLFGLPEDLA